MAKVKAFIANIIDDVGLGVFRRMDVVLGGLDNREARLAINQSCYKVNKPWIDGAIEVLNGFARVFIPGKGACYECTMTDTDWQLINKRESCALLTHEEMASGKIPTTPTSSSIIAGIQVQEMLKLLHSDRDLPTLAGKGYTVQPGDTLTKICNSAGIDYSANSRIILSINGIENANQIFVGQIILLPVKK